MNVLALLFALGWRNIWRQRKRCLLLMSAISLAVVSMVLVGAFTRATGEGLIDDYAHNLSGHAQAHHRDFRDDPSIEHSYTLPAAGRELLNNDPAVAAWSERLIVPGLIRSERQTLPVLLYGIDPQAEQGLSFIADELAEGRLMTDGQESGMVLGAELARRLHTRVGRRVVLISQGLDGEGLDSHTREIGARVRGLYRRQQGMERTIAFIGLGQLRDMLGAPSLSTQVVLKVTDQAQLIPLQRRLQRLLPELEILRWDELNPWMKLASEFKNVILGFWISLSFGVVAFGLINTLLASFYERLHEFGLTQALGLKPRDLVLQVLIEASLLVGVATAAGLAVGVLCLLALSDGVSLASVSAGLEILGMQSVLYPRPDLGEMLLISALVLSLGILASLYPALHASRHLPRDILTRS